VLLRKLPPPGHEPGDTQAQLAAMQAQQMSQLRLVTAGLLTDNLARHRLGGSRVLPPEVARVILRRLRTSGTEGVEERVRVFQAGVGAEPCGPTEESNDKLDSDLAIGIDVRS
jgi:hypothetical protein